MKKIIFVLVFLLSLPVMAQNTHKWGYLTRPLPENMFIEKKISESSTTPRLVEKNNIMLFKLNGAISAGALTYNSDTKTLEPGVWVGAGPVLSFRQYKADENGAAYQTFGFGVGAILGTSLTEVNLNALKAVLNFEIGSKFSFGYGYAVVTNTPNLRHSILFNTRFDF
jgi:hypothetical protein